MRKRTLIVLAIVATALAASAMPSSAMSFIKKKIARGDYAIAVVAANVNDPNSLYVRVTSRPRQSVDGYWLVVCSKGFGAGTRDGHFHGTTPFTKRLRMPYSDPDSCTVSADAQLSGEGQKIKVALLRG